MRPGPEGGRARARPATSSPSMVLNRAKRLYRLALVDPDVPPSRRAVALAEAEALARLLVEVFTEFRRPAALALLQTAVALMKEAGGLELPQSSPDPA